jgi:hypothetical protein
VTLPLANDASVPREDHLGNRIRSQAYGSFTRCKKKRRGAMLVEGALQGLTHTTTPNRRCPATTPSGLTRGASSVPSGGKAAASRPVSLPSSTNSLGEGRARTAGSPWRPVSACTACWTRYFQLTSPIEGRRSKDQRPRTTSAEGSY